MQRQWQHCLVLAAAGVIFSSHQVRAQQTGPGGAPSGNAVASVFGRTGNVAATSGDYTAAQVTNAAATNSVNTFTANQAIADGDTLQFPLAGNDTVVVGNWEGVFEATDTTSGDFIISAGSSSEAGNSYFGIGSTSPILWFTPAFVPNNVVAGLTWVNTGTISLDDQGDGSGDGWLMVSAIGNGASSNTDLRGHITLASGSGSYTFTNTYEVAPTCVATDTTTTVPIKVTVTTTTLTLTGTGSDVLNYICAE